MSGPGAAEGKLLLIGVVDKAACDLQKQGAKAFVQAGQGWHEQGLRFHLVGALCVVCVHAAEMEVRLAMFKRSWLNRCREKLVVVVEGKLKGKKRLPSTPVDRNSGMKADTAGS